MTRAQSSLAPDGPAEAARPARAVGALSPLDAELIHSWGATLVAGGASASSVARDEQRIRALARFAQTGLRGATAWNVAEIAAARARARGCTPAVLMRSESWAKRLRALTGFYAWAEARGLIDANPLRGIRRVPPVARPVRVSTRLARHYDALLHHPDLSARDRALLVSLAHGLTPTEAVRLRVEDVNADAQLLRVGGPRRRVRVLPLSARAAEVLGAQAEQQARLGATWLFDRGPRTRDGVRPLFGRPAISTSLVRDVVRQAAAHVFPLASQRGIRRRLRAGGFGDLFRARLLRSRLPLDVVVEVFGVDRVSHLRRYTTSVTLARLHREWARVTARRRWI